MVIIELKDLMLCKQGKLLLLGHQMNQWIMGHQLNLE